MWSTPMIPLKLQIKNFLSYGATLQTIDFAPYHLICLSGKNGHGKSALLDAITWAIWGQARKISGVAKADTHLLRLGQQQMLVILDFEFNQRHYRIRREFALTHGKQYASLDFALIEFDKTISLTNKTIRETQAVIETTVGLDFESFINSAFLRQGQSNEFSKKSPKERKDILGTILGLNHYELLKKKALDKVKNATMEIAHLSKFQEKLNHELIRLPELTASVLTVNQSLAILDEHEKLCVTQKNALNDKKNQLQAEKNQQSLITLQCNQKEEEVAKTIRSLQENYEQWRLLHKKYLNYKRLEDHEKHKQELLNKMAKLQNEHQKHLTIKEKELLLKQREQELVTKIKSEHAKKVHECYMNLTTVQHELLTKKELVLTTEKQKTKIENELKTIQESLSILHTTLNELTWVHSSLKNAENLFEKRKTHYLQWGSELNALTTEIKQLQQKQILTSDESNPSCPLCEQNLSASRKKFLKSHFLHRLTFLNHRTMRLKTVIATLKQLLIDQNQTLEQLKKKLQEFTTAEIRSKELCNQAEKLTLELQEYTHQITAVQQEHERLNAAVLKQQILYDQIKGDENNAVTHNRDYLAVQAELTGLEAERDALRYQHSDLDTIRDQLLNLENIICHAQSIEQELDKKRSIAKTITDLCQAIKKLKNEHNELIAKKAHYQSLDVQMQQIQSLEITIEQTELRYKKEKESLLQQRGSLEKERMTLMGYETEYKVHHDKIKELQELCYDYQNIAHALGKDGIQALIIEDALPEIEQEANYLLGQLTDNQAHIIIDSLRDLKKGGTKETLDIKISDSIGIRPYELFSGGEAFRIDFALRLAISKLLARRAGTSLQTLIIDEGFGSQDEDGLSHIMDALYKIQNNFCKIIIVSHLASMKDQFPVHFFIEKGSQGSNLRIIEQG